MATKIIEKYNGWSNYPTWNFNLWIQNDSTYYLYVENKISEIKKNESDHEIRLNQLEDFLSNCFQEDYENFIESKDGSYLVDILGWVKGLINFREIAKGIMEA